MSKVHYTAAAFAVAASLSLTAVAANVVLTEMGQGKAPSGGVLDLLLPGGQTSRTVATPNPAERPGNPAFRVAEINLTATQHSLEAAAAPAAVAPRSPQPFERKIQLDDYYIAGRVVPVQTRVVSVDVTTNVTVWDMLPPALREYVNPDMLPTQFVAVIDAARGGLTLGMNDPVLGAVNVDITRQHAA